ncbi:ATP-dependent DNA helicase [Mycoplasma leonicaptivi]|uniref:ATP-dependent DNA helicase n=1 Tax=Mycoplasma leonicaptivi TaxID=36742 RepID=UPI0004827A6F|nr:AAA family ATPase [Mycoplasma leonicaptivi]
MSQEKEFFNGFEVFYFQGKITRFIKGDSGSPYALCLFRVENAKEIVLYSTNQRPKLFEKVEVKVYKKPYNGKNNTYTLISFIPVIEEINPTKELEDILLKIPKIGKTSVSKITNAGIIDFFKILNLETTQNTHYDFIKQEQFENIKKYYDKNYEKITKIINSFNNDPELLKKNNQYFYPNNLQNFYEFLKTKHNGTFDFQEIYLKLPEKIYDLYSVDKQDFNNVDKFAMWLGVDKFNKIRVKNYVKLTLKDLENNNSTYINYDDILRRLRLNNLFMHSQYVQETYLNEITSNEIEFSHILDNVLQEMVNNNELILYYNINPNYKYSLKMFCLYETYLKEKNIIEKLLFLTKSQPKIFKTLVKKDIDKLSDEQRIAYNNFLSKNISFIVGGPGTGKSLTIDHIYKTLIKNKQKNNEDFVILTPTGRAATNLMLKGSTKARTIHSFLGIKDDDDTSTKSPSDFEGIQTIIIDEFSMVNVNIFNKLLNMCENLKKLVIVGDIDQLPTIGPGDMLREFYESNYFTFTTLTNNFRSGNSSNIHEYSKLINNVYVYSKELKNEFDDYCYVNDIKDSYSNDNLPKEEVYEKMLIDKHDSLLNTKGLDFVFFDSKLTKKKRDDLLNKTFEKSVQKFGIEETIILSPKYLGDLGIDKLNKIFQDLYNPNGKIVFVYNQNNPKDHLRIGDKVVQLVNRNEQNVSNGDIGFIDSVEFIDKKEYIVVRYSSQKSDFNYIKYTKDEARSELSLAYTISVHKFQGSEAKSVLFMIDNSHKTMLSKKLVYTAVSRAKNKLTIIANIENFFSHIFLEEFKKEEVIFTNIKEFLKELKWS